MGHISINPIDQGNDWNQTDHNSTNQSNQGLFGSTKNRIQFLNKF
jgi:hypothetical protein